MKPLSIPGVNSRWPVALAATVTLALIVHTLLWPAPPGPLGGWMALSVLYVACVPLLRARTPVAGGAGWPVIIVMATMLQPEDAVLGTGLAITAGAMVAAALATAGSRPSVMRRTATAASTMLAHLPPAVFLAAVSVAVGGLVRPAAALAAGAVAGILAHLLGRSLVPSLTAVGSPAPAPRLLSGVAISSSGVLQSAAIGGTAALLGVVARSGFPALFPVIAGVALLVAIEHGERRRHEMQAAAVDSLLMALEAKDLYTRGHAVRVAALCALIADELGLGAARTQRLVTAALLHDIGKIVTPRHLLRKPGPLTSREYRRVQEHASAAEDVLAEIRFLDPVVTIVTEHHWHLDGGGYGGAADGPPVDHRTPSEVSGAGRSRVNRPPSEARPSLEARIVAVADAYDAMTSHRPYRRALSTRYAAAELRACSGSQFDPEMVEALLRRTGADPARSADWGADTEEAARSAAELMMVRL